MNCTVIQRRLLSAEQPDQPESDVRSHLAQCPVCRAWQRRLVQVERQIPLLPVPPSNGRAELLQRILGPVAGDAARPPIAEPPNHWPQAPGPKERGLRKLSVAFALAASLLIFALAWWSWPQDSGKTGGVAARRMEEQDRLEQRLHRVMLVEKPQERLHRLASLAEEVHDEAQNLADNAEKLEQWAQFYARLVSKELLDQARQLPPDERPAVLNDIARRLVNAESAAARRAAQLKISAPRSAASFDQIALAARRSERDLRALLRG